MSCPDFHLALPQSPLPSGTARIVWIKSSGQHACWQNAASLPAKETK